MNDEMKRILKLELKIIEINEKLDRHVEDHWSMITAATDELNEIKKNLGGKKKCMK